MEDPSTGMEDPSSGEEWPDVAVLNMAGNELTVLNMAGDALTASSMQPLATVRDLKSHVQTTCSIPSLTQQLVFGCLSLNDDIVLANLPQPLTLTLVRIINGTTISCREVNEAWIREQRSRHWDILPWRLEIVKVLRSGHIRKLHRGILDGAVDVVAKEIHAASRMMRSAAWDRHVARLRQISHPNLVTVLGVFQAKPFYIITELCLGGTLFNLLHETDDIDLGWHQQIKLCGDVANAMNYLHGLSPPIIHGELTTQKILLALPVTSTKDMPFVKVCNAGFLKPIICPDTWSSSQRQNSRIFSAFSKAPEAITGRSFNDIKTDVYAYAMVIFEVLCREIPFEFEDPATVPRLTLSGIRPDFDNIPPNCPISLYDLMVSCWAQCPDQRPCFRSITSQLEELGQLAHDRQQR